MTSISSNYANNLYASSLLTGSTSGASSGIEASLKKGIDRVKSDIESGKIKVADLKEKLQKSFGDSVKSVFNEDGSIDFDSLESFLSQKITGSSSSLLSGSNSSSSTQTSSTLDKISLKKFLEKEYGEDAKGIIKDDGTIDMDKFVDLIDNITGGLSISSLQQTLNQLVNSGSILNVKA